MEPYRLILYLLFGTLPSFIWLLYYLKKDLHPEPKKTILKIFLLVNLGVFRRGRVDEPVDLMIYMVVAALGFAAVENILYLAVPLTNIGITAVIQTTITISFIRFIGATLLHTLCSALLGYFIVLGICRGKRNILFLIMGIVLASGFHGLYDFSIIIMPNPFNVIVPVAIILALFIIMIYNFSKARKLKSVCKI